MKLKPEVKEIWVNALESPKYKQGFGAYAWDGRHCSVGVLMQEYADKQGITMREVTDRYYSDFMDWAGVPVVSGVILNSLPEIRVAGKNYVMVELNDHLRLPFPEIAKLIKEQL